MAEEHKKSFMLYFDNFPCVAALDAEQRGELPRQYMHNKENAVTMRLSAH